MIRDYANFVARNRSAYLSFNKQLLLAELFGFGAGIGVAEFAAFLKADEFQISVHSSIADYSASVLGFLAIFYLDNRPPYMNLSKTERIKKILRKVFSLWPTVAAADLAFILARPYFHYLLLVASIETVLASTIAHFAAFGVFNMVAIFSRSIIDYSRNGNVN